MIVTFYNDKINPIVVELQKKVFEHFNANILQIKPSKWVRHGLAINDYIDSIGENWEYLVLFDIDCVPLDDKIIPESIEWALSNTGVFGVAQNANHIKDSIVYAAPSFMVFSKKTYNLLGRPSFAGNSRSDTGGELTHECIAKGYDVKLLYPTEFEVPRWKLTEIINFGRATTFENRIFHDFQSAQGRNFRFIRKCKKIINPNFHYKIFD